MRQLLVLCLLLFSAMSFAVVEGYKYQFDNEVDKLRFEDLAEELRCPKCQNQNLADSNAPVARDLRDKLYELVKDGRSDMEIMDFMVSRYGDFVRYKPEVKSTTFVLWFGPAIMFVIALIVVVMMRVSKKSSTSVEQSPSTLTQAEQEKLAELKAKKMNQSNNDTSDS